ncbi:MAG: hypothetical protein V1792_25450 [Pseudomonadota bacterium]
MKSELTKQELLKITGINRRTFEEWNKDDLLPPVRRGGGRGQQSIFDIHCAAWSVALSELFRVCRHKSTLVILREWKREGKKFIPVWTECLLTDGNRVLEYLRTPYYFQPERRVVLLTTGFVGIGVPSAKERFAEIRIGPAEHCTPFVENWLKDDAPTPYTTLEYDSEKVVRSAAFINLDEVYRQVAFHGRNL